MTSTAVPTSEVLNCAADLIEEHGHAIGNGWPGADGFTGAYCLEGAIMGALGRTYSDGLIHCPAYTAVCEYLTGPVNPKSWPPFLWQDQLTWEQDDAGNLLYRWAGGTETAAREYAKSRVIETLRATALIEAAKENAALPEAVSA